MPLDGICLNALVKELAPQLIGARIDKVQQPERDLLLLSLYTKGGGNRRLLISAGVGSARFHFTGVRTENPESPPMFCMLLRKHLAGARIVGVSQPNYERLAVIEVISRDELGDESKKSLVVEMMGRSSNVILVDSEGRIIDCLRRADFGEDAVRRLLPGMLYRLPPPQSKPSLFALTSQRRSELWAQSDAQTPDEKRLMSVFSGLSPLIARELAFRAGDDMPAAMDALVEVVQAGEFLPVLVSEDGAPRDFSFMTINQYGPAAVCEVMPDFSALLDAFYSERDKAERIRRISGDTLKTVRTLRDRQARKLAQQRQELEATGDRERVRRSAELITANMWRVGKGARSLVCEDYFEPDAPEITISLDPLKTPQQNAAALYRTYKKASAARTHLTQLIAEGETRLFYLESVMELLARAEGERDVAEIRRELREQGIIRRGKNEKQQKLKPRAPMRFVSSSGYEILVGRSNAQNDELTFKLARRSDVWLHAQRIHGSHVVIRANDTQPDDATLGEAASLAALFSQGRESGRVPVDYTHIKYVRKPQSALPGMVVYTEQRTLTARPDESLAERLKA